MGPLAPTGNSWHYCAHDSTSSRYIKRNQRIDTPSTTPSYAHFKQKCRTKRTPVHKLMHNYIVRISTFDLGRLYDSRGESPQEYPAQSIWRRRFFTFRTSLRRTSFFGVGICDDPHSGTYAATCNTASTI